MKTPKQILRDGSLLLLRKQDIVRQVRTALRNAEAQIVQCQIDLLFNEGDEVATGELDEKIKLLQTGINRLRQQYRDILPEVLKPEEEATK